MPLLETKTPNIEDLKIGQYKVMVLDAEQGTSQDLSELVSSIQWDYDLDQAAEHYQITFVHTENIAQRVKPGDRIKLYGYACRPVGSQIEMYWELLKRIYIASTSLSSSSGGELRVSGYNVMWFLMRNSDSVMLEQETASQFIRRTAAYYGIPLGEILETGVTLEREPFMNRTIWDMWVSALSYTRDLSSNARFLLQEREGKIDLISRTPPGAVWNFHRGRFIPGPEAWNNNPGNIFSSTNNFSMENYANVVRVYKGGGADQGSVLLEGTASDAPFLQFQYPPQNVIEARQDKQINMYGMFLESVDLQMPGESALNLGNDGANAEQQGMKLYAKLSKFENTGTITTFNVNTIKPGDQVHIRDDITGLVGKYYVKSGNHTVTDSETSMTLTVNIEDALPEAYAARPQRQAKEDNSLLGPAPPVSGPTGTNWTYMSGSISIPDRYALALAAGFKPGDDALKMTTISTFECGNCDMRVPSGSQDIGLWQINQIHWSNYGGQEALTNPRNNARAAFGVWSGVGGGEAGFKQWCTYPGGCGGASPISQSVFDARMAQVRAAVASGGNTQQTGWAPIDGRGKLPTYSGMSYGSRQLAGIIGVTLHYTAGSPNQSVYDVAAYQTSEAASGQTGTGTPFPGLAYTYFVELDGKTTLAHDLSVETWHSSAGQRNQKYIGICYAGDVAPSEAQMTAMGQAIGHAQKQLGKQLAIEGHKDAMSTECPGPQWPSWKQTVLNRIPPNL